MKNTFFIAFSDNGRYWRILREKSPRMHKFPALYDSWREVEKQTKVFNEKINVFLTSLLLFAFASLMCVYACVWAKEFTGIAGLYIKTN